MTYKVVGLIHYLHKDVLWIIPKTAFAAAEAFAHCLVDFRDLSIITPKSLSPSTA